MTRPFYAPYLRALAKAVDVTAAMTVEALMGTDRAFAPELQALRPHPGQAAAAGNLTRLLAGPGIVENAALVIDDGSVVWIGPAAGAPTADVLVDVGGRAVVPGFVDSHTHMVFASDRADELVARMAGEPYSGGGILRTVAATRTASTADLRRAATNRLAEMTALGTTTVEIKSAWSATRGGALALRRNELGRIAAGGPADLVVLDAPSFVHLAYRPGSPLVTEVWRRGTLIPGSRGPR